MYQIRTELGSAEPIITDSHRTRAEAVKIARSMIRQPGVTSVAVYGTAKEPYQHQPFPVVAWYRDGDKVRRRSASGFKPA